MVYIILYCISALLIILGFIALLSQKIYLDSTTMEPVSIKLPIVGKLKTNYPALVFVFLGVFLAIYVFNKDVPTDDWEISGYVKADVNETVDWNYGLIRAFPCAIKPEYGPGGYYKLILKIERGKEFEDVIDKIEYSHPKLKTVYFCPDSEMVRSNRRDPNSLLESSSRLSRNYKPMSSTLISQE